MQHVALQRYPGALLFLLVRHKKDRGRWTRAEDMDSDGDRGHRLGWREAVRQKVRASERASERARERERERERKRRERERGRESERDKRERDGRTKSGERRKQLETAGREDTNLALPRDLHAIPSRRAAPRHSSRGLASGGVRAPS